MLTAAEGGHGGGSAEDSAGGADTEAAANVQTAAVTSDDDGAPMWLAITASAVGAVGLIAGVGGLMAGRRRTR